MAVSEQTDGQSTNGPTVDGSGHGSRGVSRVRFIVVEMTTMMKVTIQRKTAIV